jgi:sugar (pentulose or hexulose) kinase
MGTGKEGLLLSIDLGTSNIKGAVYDISGREVAFCTKEYNLYTPSNSIVENKVSQYWNYVKKIIKELVKILGPKAKNILTISTSSQGETIVPIDKNGNALRNAIVWLDTRSTEEAELIRNNFDIKKLYSMTGYPDVDTSWPATRIMWIKKNEPEIFANTYKFLLLEDYIIFKLTGKFVGEASVYGSSYYYDIINFKYIDPVLDFIGVSKEKLPEIYKPGSVVGKMLKEVAAQTGLSPDIKVVIGAIDQICGAVGAGNIREGIVTETTGSCFAMVITIRDPIFNNTYKLPCTPHAVSGFYALMPYSTTGGMVLKWFKDKFCTEEMISSKKSGKNVFKILDNLAANIPAGSEGLIMLPFISGAFFPEYNPYARGVFFNFGINHTKGHFIRAVLESLGYMMRSDLDIVNNLGLDISKIISVGGGASSNLWSQIKADICNIKIEIPEYTETALLGSAMMAATAIGLFNNLGEASKNLMKTKRSFVPEIGTIKLYSESFEKYRKLYMSLKDLF